MGKVQAVLYINYDNATMLLLPASTRVIKAALILAAPRKSYLYDNTSQLLLASKKPELSRVILAIPALPFISNAPYTARRKGFTSANNIKSGMKLTSIQISTQGKVIEHE